MKNKLEKSQRAALIDQISSYLHHKCEQIIICYLFGSFINEESFVDIDVAVVTRKTPDMLLAFEIDLESRLEKIARHPVDVRNINQAPLSFCQNVIRRGKVILDRDPNFRADFEGKILKQYFDFAPYHERYLKEVTNAPI
jgi:predicted nucleotidyltransferase